MNNKGFSLIEVLVYISLFSVIAISMGAFFMIISKGQIRNQAISEVNWQGSMIMELLSNNIKNSQGINIPLANSTSTNLSLVMSEITINPTEYNLVDNTLILYEGAEDGISLNNDLVLIKNLVFYNINNGKNIKFEFDIEYNNKNNIENKYKKNFVGSASLRKN